MSQKSSATHNADVGRASGLGKYRKSQDQQCPSCARSKTLVMPGRRRTPEHSRVMYGSALGMSGLGLLLGLLTVQSFPVAGCLAVVSATAGLLYSAVEFFPVTTYPTKPQKEMTHGGRRSR